MTRSRLAAVVAVAAAFALGCGKPPPPPTHGSGGGSETVRGRVTYNGKPVPYGFVLFYSDASIDPKTGLFSPIAVGALDEDGAFEMHGIPAGGVEVVVATSPDVDPAAFTEPALPGQDLAGPPAPAPGPAPPPVVTPAAALSDEQKRTLRAILAKYGVFGKSGLTYTVTPGEQTHDIDLK